MASRFTLLSLFALPVLVAGSCPTPYTISGYNNDRLPNPFILNSGKTVRNKDDWTCRRSQIGALIQGYEAGILPPRPPVVSAAFALNGTVGNLTVTAGLSKAKTISFSQSITYPSGKAPSGGWPLLITYGGLSIPVPDGIAVLIYNNDNVGQQNSNPASRGVGRFFDLYGANATASAMTAWTWGISRIVDALEMSSRPKINTKKIAVTGCSRNGKGALMAGAFESRIALTIPQESGSGGDTCWRLSKYEQDSGDVVQQATEIVQENVWFSANFDNYVNSLSTLPYDHHALIGMVAPRGLIAYENTDFEWLSPLSSWGCEVAGHTVYQALGVPDNHGFVEVGGHAHCNFPASLNNTLFPFFDKFLNGDKSANTEFFETNGLWNGTEWNQAYWVNWATPDLS